MSNSTKASPPPVIRAKFVVKLVTDDGISDHVKLEAVHNGTPEDNTFARYTPAGHLELQVNNSAVKGTMKPGQKYYLDFTLAEEEPA